MLNPLIGTEQVFGEVIYIVTGMHQEHLLHLPRWTHAVSLRVEGSTHLWYVLYNIHTHTFASKVYLVQY